MYKVDFNRKVIQGAFGTFRPGIGRYADNYIF